LAPLRDGVTRAEVFFLAEVLLAFVRRDFWALGVEDLLRLAAVRLRLVVEVVRVLLERFRRAEVVRLERAEARPVRARPVDLRAVVLRPILVPLARRELLPRVEALRVPAERVPEVLRDAAVLRRAPDLRPEARWPLPAAWAVSREISLLKLLFFPSAVVSSYKKARPLSSNFLKQSSQLISSSVSSPL
jgi:hypothetical protein